MTFLPDKPVAVWCAALRSGQYQQGRGCLKRCNGKLCCLGVACEIVPGFKWLPDNAAQAETWAEFGGRAFPPDAVQDLFGLSGREVMALSELNDTDLQTFEQIADALARWKGAV